MALVRALVGNWKEFAFLALLILISFNNVCARELIVFGTNVVAPRREMGIHTNDAVILGRKLIAHQLDMSWKGNYFPPRSRYTPPPSLPRSRPRFRPIPPR